MSNFFDSLENEPKDLITPDEMPPEFISEWLYDFCTDICGHIKLAPQPHQEFCVKVEQFAGDCQFNTKGRKALLILLPRGSFKSTILGQDFPIGVLTKNHNARILVTAHKDKVSTKRVEAVKAVFESSAPFHNKYGDDWKPEFRSAQWSTKAITISKRKEIFREASLEVSSVGADTTGSHYNVIIADDLVTKENVGTIDQRDKVHDYIKSLYPLLDPGGILIIIGTRWHPDDAYGRIIKEDQDREAKGDMPLYEKHIRSCYDGPNGLFFPEEQSHEELDDLKVRMGSRLFAANYLNQPIAEEDKTFKAEYLQEVLFTFYLTKNQGVVKTNDGQYPVYTSMAWDTAGTKQNAKSDYHGLTIVGCDLFNRWWIPVAEGVKGTPTDVVKRVVAHIIAYRPTTLLIEAVGAYGHWSNAIYSELEPLGIHISIQEVSHGGQAKEVRIEQLEPLWTARRIILQPGLADLKSQLDAFSLTSLPGHDDIIDSLAMHLGYTKPGDAVIEKEKANHFDPEYTRMKKFFNKEPQNQWRRGTRWAI